jgi:hypothetical protein
MEKYVSKIVILNKKFYLDKEINYGIYIQELSSILKTSILDYNMYLQINNNNILSNFINSSNYVKPDNTSEITRRNFDFSNVDVRTDVVNTSEIMRDNIADSIADKEDEDDEENTKNTINKYISDNDNANTNVNSNAIDNANANTSSNVNPNLGQLDQCCARVDNQIYNLDEYDPEFIDNYPSGVYINEDGCIIGSPCCNTVENYDEITNIFCDEHIDGFEDIREPYNMKV